jgi:hypothetical protein
MTTDSPRQAGSRVPVQRRPEVAGPWRGDRRADGRPAGGRPPQPADGQEPDRPEVERRRGGRSEEAREAREQVAARTRPARPRTRRAHLRAARLDPWSVMKVAFMLSIAIAIVGVVAVVVLWSALSAADVFGTINGFVRDQATFGQQGRSFDVLKYIGLNRVLGVTLLLAVVNVVLWTALATLFSFVYNLTAGLLGGIEVTLAETD